MTIRCHTCRADPAGGRWRSPPMCIFVDHVGGERVSTPAATIYRSGVRKRFG